MSTEVGVAAMSRKATSQSMQTILAAMVERAPQLRVVIFEEEMLLNHSVESWPHVDVLLAFHSEGYPLEKVIQYAQLVRPMLVNDLRMQQVMLDRRHVYTVLRDAGVPQPITVTCDHDAGDRAELHGDTLIVFPAPAPAENTSLASSSTTPIPNNPVSSVQEHGTFHMEIQDSLADVVGDGAEAHEDPIIVAPVPLPTENTPFVSTSPTSEPNIPVSVQEHETSQLEIKGPQTDVAGQAEIHEETHTVSPAPDSTENTPLFSSSPTHEPGNPVSVQEPETSDLEIQDIQTPEQQQPHEQSNPVDQPAQELSAEDIVEEDACPKDETSKSGSSVQVSTESTAAHEGVLDHVETDQSDNVQLSTESLNVEKTSENQPPRSMTIRKPFVEKPLNADDHSVYIYYSGGGVHRLFRKVNNQSSILMESDESIRMTGSYVYQEFHEPEDRLDIKVYAVQAKYIYAESRKAPFVDGFVDRTAEGREVRRVITLSEQELEMCKRVARAFGQFVIGFDLLRSSDASYIIDVNGWSFVKSHTDFAVIAGRMMADYIMEKLPTQAEKGEGNEDENKVEEEKVEHEDKYMEV